MNIESPMKSNKHIFSDFIGVKVYHRRIRTLQKLEGFSLQDPISGQTVDAADCHTLNNDVRDFIQQTLSSATN